MKNRMLRTMALLGVAALGCTFAQETAQMTAEIPFTFRAGNHMMPPGAYTVNRDMRTGMVVIAARDGKVKAYMQSNARLRPQKETEGKLVFRRYGETYFLSQIWTPANDIGGQLTPSAAEREMAAPRSHRDVASVMVYIR